MATGRLSGAVRHLRRAALLREGAGLSDGALLQTYLACRDEAAFEALVGRHGPMVLGVCRRILVNEADVEDAFQATFLVLVRKAASIVPPEQVGNWLYGVAYHIALKARAGAGRRRARERLAGEVRLRAGSEEAHPLIELLDRELNRLPDRYRAPLVLCALEGRPIQEAARRLDWPVGTVASRLSRGRALLARRLARHGPLLTAGALALGLPWGAEASVVPPSLVLATVRASAALGAGRITTASAPAGVAALTAGVLRAMLLKRVQVVAMTLLLAVGLVLGGGGLALSTRAAEENPGPQRTAPKLGQQPAPKAPAPAGLFVLDDCDPDYQGKQAYADNLTYLDHAGKVIFRVSGLNNCQTIGSNNMIAVDRARGWVWVLEIVGHTVRKYDFKGKELLKLENVRASALAVDPNTGNVWVVTSDGTIQGEKSDKTVVFDPQGKRLATHNVTGWDITYDSKGKAFWLAGPNLTRITPGGETLVIEKVAAGQILTVKEP